MNEKRAYFRRLTSRVLFVVSLTPILVLFLSSNIFAYIDPSSGSYFFQFILAGILGALFAVKMYWRRIVSFFKGGKSENK